MKSFNVICSDRENIYEAIVSANSKKKAIKILKNYFKTYNMKHKFDNYYARCICSIEFNNPEGIEHLLLKKTILKSFIFGKDL